MNIIFVSTAYIEPDKPSTGLPNYLRRASWALINNGHSVTILYSAPYNQERMDDGIEVIATRVPLIRIKDCVREVEDNCLIKSYLINKKLDELIEKRHFDVIQFTSLDGIGKLYHARVPAVLRLSSYCKTYFSSKRTFDKETIECRSSIERDAAKYMDGIYAPCYITADAFGKDIGKPVDVIETLFENDVREPDAEFFETNLKGHKYALFFGTLYAEKGIAVIAEALYKFLEMFKDYYFVAIGDVLKVGEINADDLLFKAAGEYADRVKIFDPVPHDSLYPVIEHADFVVLPSLMDNLPNACIEAMYFRRVVIGTDGASFEQLITDGKNGFLCKIGDPDSLLKKMKKAASLSEGEKERLGDNARKRIDMLRPEKVVNQLIEYYRGIIDSAEMGGGSANAKKRDKAYSDYIKAGEYIEKQYGDLNKEYIADADKRFLQNRILVQWIKIIKAGRSCSEFFRKHGYNRVAVYGVYDLGQLLIDELLSEGIQVEYGIDRKKRKAAVKTYFPTDTLPEADVMVITPISYYEEIRREMEISFSGEIVSLESVILGL